MTRHLTLANLNCALSIVALIIATGNLALLYRPELSAIRVQALDAVSKLHVCR